jgi:copper transport protein
VRSAVDGHITEGSLPFGVGVAVATTWLIPPLGAPDPATLPPPPLETIARWLYLLAAVLALGGLPFGLLVWRPAFRATTGDRPFDTAQGRQPTTSDSGDWELALDDHQTSTPNRQAPTAHHSLEAADESIARFIRRATALGGLLFALANLFFLLTQAAAAANVSLLQAIGSPALKLLSDGSGLLWLARLALTLQIVVLAWRLPPAGRGPARLWWALLAIGGMIVLTLSLRSNAAASPAALAAVPLSWLHLATTIAWLGGLIPLVFAIRAVRLLDQPMPPAPLIRRYLWLTLISVVILTATGIYSYILHIGALDLLAATTYGRALLIKLGLFGALLGALNLLMRPWLRSVDSARRVAGSFGDRVRWELAAGALVLLAAAAMASVAPSKAAWQAHEQQGIAQSARAGAVDLTLRIAPAQIGDNEFAVDIVDRRPGAPAAPARVLLSFDMLGMEMGDLQTEARPAGRERYIARGSFASMGGRWQIEVVVQRAGFDDVRHVFEVDIVRGAPFVISQ